MALDPEAIGKPFKKLRKLLKDLPNPPAAEDVHDIRTHTRRIEAIVGAFQLDGRKAGKGLLKDLKPIRKAAGDVRDMDVLTDLVASIDPGGDGNCRLKLIQHLSGCRTKAATKLAKKVRANEKQLRTELKDCGEIAEDGFHSASSAKARKKDREKSREKAARSMASSLEIEEEMQQWPRLSKDNLHPFRLKVKELRYTLQLGQDSESKLIDALGKVKDQVGLWHDWNELAVIAAEVLDHGSGCPVVAQIRSRADEELQSALDAANALREQYLRGESSRSKEKESVKKSVDSEFSPALISAASRLAS